jgi:hypothetical protein
VGAVSSVERRDQAFDLLAVEPGRTEFNQTPNLTKSNTKVTKNSCCTGPRVIETAEQEIERGTAIGSRQGLAMKR